MSNPQSSNSLTPPSSPQDKSTWQSEVLFFDGDQYFHAALREIDSAADEVLVEAYIFDLDTIGLRFLQTLETAVKRGVKVRILVDGVGSFNWLPQLRTDCKKRNIGFRIYHPLPFRLSVLKRISWKRLRRLLVLFRRMNKRNHRKSITIDGKKAFLGSFNITQVHSTHMMGIHAWRDTGVFVEGPGVLSLRQAFLHAWNKSKFDSLSDHSNLIKRRLRTFSNGPIRLNSRLRWRYSLIRDLSLRMKRAQTRILITNGYFLPRRSVLRGIRKAARRGIFVGLCIPAKSDTWIVKAAAKSLYLRMINDGVHIFEYQPTVMHAKTLIIDNWATVGSHNLNHRSLIHDLEVEATLVKNENIQLLIAKWDEDVRNSKMITRSDLGKMGLWQKLLSRFAYWFRYWI